MCQRQDGSRRAGSWPPTRQRQSASAGCGMSRVIRVAVTVASRIANLRRAGERPAGGRMFGQEHRRALAVADRQYACSGEADARRRSLVADRA